MDTSYRKGSPNDSQPLSRRPDLVELNEQPLDSQPDTKKAIELYDASQFEKELEALQHHLNVLYELQFDKEIILQKKMDIQPTPGIMAIPYPSGLN